MISVELFAALAEYTGSRKMEIEFRAGITCSEVWSQLADRFPKIRAIKPLYAINDEYVSPETQLNEGQTLLLFPPVSGG